MLEHRYHKIQAQPDKIEQLLIKRGVKAIPGKSAEIVLDFDATDDRLHGSQQGAYFHGYYRHYCYLPLYCFCGNIPLLAQLRDCKGDASDGTVEALLEDRAGHSSTVRQQGSNHRAVPTAVLPVMRSWLGAKTTVCSTVWVWHVTSGYGERLKANFESLKVQIQEAKAETPCLKFYGI